MRILIVTMLYEPDRAGIAPIATDLGRGLAALGHDVTVRTTHPYYPEWKRKSSASPWRVQRETLGGVKVERFGLFVPDSPSRLIPRLLHEASFPLSLLRSLIARDRHDAVVVFCPLMGAVAFACVRKLFHREPLWVNVQDLPVDAAVATGIARSTGLRWIAGAVQRALFDRADVLSSISPTMVARLRELQGGRKAVRLHPNWLVEGLARRVDSLPSKVGRAAGETVRLLHAGNIGRKQGLLDFCRRLAATDLDFRFRIIGEGAEGRALREWLDTRSDGRFTSGPFVEESELVQALHDADLFVITERPGAGASFMPSKLIPSISSGTPVLAPCDHDGPLGREVAEHGLGFLADWEDMDIVTSAISSARDERVLGEMQRNCLRRAKDYRRETALRFAEETLETLIHAPAARVESHG